MEFLIFSDSHGRVEGMQRALRAQIRRPDLILHLGDGVGDLDYLQTRGTPTLGVRGNCDWFTVSLPINEELCFEELGHRILMVHGHRYGVKSGVGSLLVHAAARGADIVFFGHTHIPHEECIPAGTELGGVVLNRPMYLFNPGSVGRSSTSSFGTLSLTEDTVLFSHGEVII